MSVIGSSSITVDEGSRLAEEAQKRADTAVQIAGSKNRIYTDVVAPPIDNAGQFVDGDRWNVTDDSGVAIIAMYVFSGGKWIQNSWDALTLSVKNLSALSADLGNVTAGNLTAVNLEGSKFHISSPGVIDNPKGGTQRFTEDYLLDSNGFHEKYNLYSVDTGDGTIPTVTRNMGVWIKNGTVYLKNDDTVPKDSDAHINVNGLNIPAVQTRIIDTDQIELGMALRIGMVTNDVGYGLQVGTYGGLNAVLSDSVYTSTSSNAANIYMTVNGAFKRSTSASKYKVNISKADNQLDLANRLLTVDLSTWVDKGAADRYAKTLSDGSDSEAESIEPHYGLVAEHLRDAGLDMFLEYNADGGIEGIQYDRAWIPLIAKVREQQNKINEYELRISKLEKKMEDLINE